MRNRAIHTLEVDRGRTNVQVLPVRLTVEVLGGASHLTLIVETFGHDGPKRYIPIELSGHDAATLGNIFTIASLRSGVAAQT